MAGAGFLTRTQERHHDKSPLHLITFSKWTSELRSSEHRGNVLSERFLCSESPEAMLGLPEELAQGDGRPSADAPAMVPGPHSQPHAHQPPGTSKGHPSLQPSSGRGLSRRRSCCRSTRRSQPQATRLPQRHTQGDPGGWKEGKPLALLGYQKAAQPLGLQERVLTVPLSPPFLHSRGRLPRAGRGAGRFVPTREPRCAHGLPSAEPCTCCHAAGLVFSGIGAAFSARRPGSAPGPLAKPESPLQT